MRRNLSHLGNCCALSVDIPRFNRDGKRFDAIRPIRLDMFCKMIEFAMQNGSGVHLD